MPFALPLRTFPLRRPGAVRNFTYHLEYRPPALPTGVVWLLEPGPLGNPNVWPAYQWQTKFQAGIRLNHRDALI